LAIEQGFVALVQSRLAVAGVRPPGGFFVQMPKDTISETAPQAWTFRWITDREDVLLTGEASFTQALVQIDCHGYAPADAISLAAAIKSVLRSGLSGRLGSADPDNTLVDSIIRQPSQVDGFNDANRTYVRSLEYLVSYYQS
jgi:hypothetical protein